MDDKINVMALEQAGGLKDGDTLLLIRDLGDGMGKKCYRIMGSDFAGKSAYDVAVESGYEGSYEDWQAQVMQVADFDLSYDAENGSIIITK